MTTDLAHRVKTIRRIINFLWNFATDAQVMEIAKLLKVKTEIDNG